MTARGMARLGSASVVIAGTGSGLGLVGSAVSYVTGETEADKSKEEVDAFTSLMTYGKGSEYVFQEGDGDYIRAANISYTNPFSVFGDPLRLGMKAIQEGNDLGLVKSKFLDALDDSSGEYFSTILGTKEGLKPFLQLLLHDDLPEEQQDRLWEKFYKALAPKVIQDAFKYGSIAANPDIKYTKLGNPNPKFKDAAMAVVTGSHYKDLNMPQQISRKLSDLQRKSTSIRKKYKEAIYHKGIKDRMSPSDIEDLKAKMHKYIIEDIDIKKQMWGVVKNARILTKKDAKGNKVRMFTELRLKKVLTHHNSITNTYKGEKGVGVKLSGTRMSDADTLNLTSSNPMYYPEDLDKIIEAKDLRMPAREAWRSVIAKYNNISLIHTRP